MSIVDQAKIELAAINFGDEDSAVMVVILEKFFDQWDSGGAVSVAAPVLMRLLNGQPLKPLTGEDGEWMDCFDNGSMLQNKRCSSVFKDWRCEDGSLSREVGAGKLTIHDINNPGWDGRFPYDPSTRLPASPVLEIASI